MSAPATVFFFLRIFSWLFFIYFQSFCLESADRRSPRKYFFIVCKYLSWDLSRGLTSNKPALYPLDLINHNSWRIQKEQLDCIIGDWKRIILVDNEQSSKVCNIKSIRGGIIGIPCMSVGEHSKYTTFHSTFWVRAQIKSNHKIFVISLHLRYMRSCPENDRAEYRFYMWNST